MIGLYCLFGKLLWTSLLTGTGCPSTSVVVRMMSGLYPLFYLADLLICMSSRFCILDIMCEHPCSKLFPSHVIGIISPGSRVAVENSRSIVGKHFRRLPRSLFGLYILVIVGSLTCIVTNAALLLGSTFSCSVTCKPSRRWGHILGGNRM